MHAFEQAIAEFTFQPLHLLADRRLRHAQFGSRSGEALASGASLEHPQQAPAMAWVLA